MPGWLGRVPAALAVAMVVPLAAAFTTASAATAPPQLPVALSACGTGSSAVWDATGDPVLTVGSANAATCGAPAGSTYDPAYAQVTLRVNGHAVPAAEPVFATDHYAQGSPRIVIDLNNGKTIVGYPAASGLNGTDMAWAVGNSGTYTGYSAAYTATDANTTTVKDAFIVEDADQVPGTSDTLTGIQFGGAQVQVLTSGQFTMKNVNSAKCLNIENGNYSPGGVTNQYTCDAPWHGETAGAQRFQYLTFADGSQYLQAISPDGSHPVFFVQATTQGAQLSLTNSPVPYVYRTGGYFNWHGLVMDVQNYSTANLANVHGWPFTGATNQQWRLETIAA